MSQYALPITLPPVFSEDNFFVSGCNREAHAWITRWPDWPAHALVLYGPRGSGKSHLSHIWAEKSGATQGEGNRLVENIERTEDERTLLHLINLSRENGHWLLLTSAVAPSALPFQLPDLTSRLKALPAAAIDPPDDEALAAALRKQFADRQLKVEEEVIAYLLPRIERSFAHVRDVVARLDEQAMREKKNLTVPFIRQALGY